MREVCTVGKGEAVEFRRPFSVPRPGAPGPFEILGSFDAGEPEAVLFMNPIYRGLMNLLILQAWAGDGLGGREAAG